LNGVSIHVIGEIGSDVTLPGFIAQLRAAGGRDVELYVDSVGGEVMTALAILTAVRGYRGAVRARVGALAASSATLVLMGVDEIIVSSSSMLMLHGPQGMALGTAETVRALAEALDRIHDAMVDAYVARLGEDRRAEVEDWLAGERWFNATESVAAGLADRIEDAPRMRLAARLGSPSFDLRLR
jgi:ATP-dependent Clp protease protease subunit